jgi:transposase InsO family protein
MPREHAPAGWYTPVELAKLKLPGLPAAHDNIRAKAAREGWQRRPRKGRGGGFEYAELTLPQAALAELLRRRHGFGQDDPDFAARMAGVAAYAALEPGRSKNLAAARLAILDAFRAWRGSTAHGARSARAFSAAYNARSIQVDEWVRALVPRLSRPTLVRWRGRLRRHGPAQLRELRRGQVVGKIASAPDLGDAILGLLGTKSDWSVALIYAALEAQANGAALPHLRTVQRWVRRWKRDNPQLALHLVDPEAARHRKAAVGSASARVERLNQLWELDSTPADVMLQGGRHAVVGLVDVFSRRAMVQVSKTSRSTAIAALLRRAIIAWGVPEVCKTDRGRDYTSRHIETVLSALGIVHETCPPYTPEAKPHIERFFGTLSRGLLPLLPGYIGPSVARRKSIRARQSAAAGEGEPIHLELTAAELQAAGDLWCETVYGRKGHRGLGGKSPFQQAQNYRGPVRRVPDVRALDVALAAPAGGDGTRRVRHGAVSVDNRDYTAPELGAHNGERVSIKLEEGDLGRVYVFQRNAFLCVAEHAELAGVSRAALAARVKAAERAMLREGKADIRRKARRTGAQDAGRAILDHAEAEAARVVAFPPASEPHLTPELEESARAAAAAKAPRKARPTDAEEEARAAADSAYWKRVTKSAALEQERREAAGE